MLVLAMEFSRGARNRRRYCRRPDEGREWSTAKKAVDFAEAATMSLPQNGTVRSDDHVDPDTGPAWPLPRGERAGRTAAENSRAPNNQ